MKNCQILNSFTVANLQKIHFRLVLERKGMCKIVIYERKDRFLRQFLHNNLSYGYLLKKLKKNRLLILI